MYEVVKCEEPPVVCVDIEISNCLLIQKIYLMSWNAINTKWQENLPAKLRMERILMLTLSITSADTTVVPWRAAGLSQSSRSTLCMMGLKGGLAYMISGILCTLYKLLNIQFSDPLQCQEFRCRWMFMYVCFGNELPHENWVTSSSEAKWFPTRFNCCTRCIIRNSGRRFAMLL